VYGTVETGAVEMVGRSESWLVVLFPSSVELAEHAEAASKNPVAIRAATFTRVGRFPMASALLIVGRARRRM
jgi:hypothetical protein